MVLMTEWRWYAVTLTTGALLGDLPLSAFSGGRSLVGGAMTAELPLDGYPADTRRELLTWTTPGRATILAERDGVVVGEWIIWKRSRSNDGKAVKLAGGEIVTALDQRLMLVHTFTGAEQLYLARTLMIEGYAAPGGITVSIPTPTPSGVLRDRTYKALDGSIGQRLKELSEVDDGFDYLVSSTRSGATVTRTAAFTYPRAGVALPYVFEMGGPGSPPGNVLSVDVDEDGTLLASRAYAVGAQTNDAATVGVHYDDALVDAGYPLFETTASYSTVITQSVIDGHAQALWDAAQTAELPVKMSALADTFPGYGDYSLGDTLTINVEPSANWPDGWQGTIRVTGWTLSPKAGSETMALTVTREPS